MEINETSARDWSLSAVRAEIKVERGREMGTERKLQRERLSEGRNWGEQGEGILKEASLDWRSLSSYSKSSILARTWGRNQKRIDNKDD